MKVGKSFKSNNLESMKEFLGMAGLFGVLCNAVG